MWNRIDISGAFYRTGRAHQPAGLPAACVKRLVFASEQRGVRRPGASDDLSVLRHRWPWNAITVTTSRRWPIEERLHITIAYTLNAVGVRPAFPQSGRGALALAGHSTASKPSGARMTTSSAWIRVCDESTPLFVYFHPSATKHAAADSRSRVRFQIRKIYSPSASSGCPWGLCRRPRRRVDHAEWPAGIAGRTASSRYFSRDRFHVNSRSSDPYFPEADFSCTGPIARANWNCVCVRSSHEMPG